MPLPHLKKEETALLVIDMQNDFVRQDGFLGKSGRNMKPVTAIVPNRYQPRMDVESRSIEELADSIRQHGVLEPIIVRPMGKGYELVVGERRWRAATAAGLKWVSRPSTSVV